MAVTKRFIFSESRKLAADFGKVIGHPARVTMVSRLAEGDVISYTDLISSIHLKSSTLYDHIEKLERSGLVHRSLLANNKAGYALDLVLYRKMLNAVRVQLNATAIVMDLHSMEDDWGGYVG
jgi:DNA-binding transcriptional ArsR family regulator